jgi:CBS domain containing-hemolysin-like protein
VAAYTATARLVLWVIALAAYAGSFVLLAMSLPAIAAVVGVGILLVLGFVVIPSLALTPLRARLAAWFSPALVGVIEPLYPVLSRLTHMVQTHRAHQPHSALYQKEDLLELIAQQKEQADNRIQAHELELAERALTFVDMHAADVALPHARLCLVDADDNIGPLLMDRLHKSGQTSFLVYRDAPETIIGSLTLRDAVAAKKGGKVLDLVRFDLCYVHEDFSLAQVLDAFHHTKYSLAVVVNSFEECVGVLTLERLLTELLGESTTPELNYESRSAIAAYEPAALDSAVVEVPEEPAAPELASPEPTEVVE